MEYFNFETIFTVIFLVVLAGLLFYYRSRLTVQKIIFPFLYFVMAKTKLGIKQMDSISKRFPRLIIFLGYSGIIIGFIGMLFLCGTLVWQIYKALFTSAAAQAVGLVLPVNVKGAFFVPFTYWIISLIIVASIHEFGHGVVARRFKMKIKSSGFAAVCLIIPIIPAAFVEPDEKDVKKKPLRQRLAMYSAGPMFNFLLGFAVLLLILLLGTGLKGMYDFTGVKVVGYSNDSSGFSPAETSGIELNETIIEIDGMKIETVSNLTIALQNKLPGDEVDVKTDKGIYELELGEHPTVKNRTYVGILLHQEYAVSESFQQRFGNAFIAVVEWFIGTPERRGLLIWLVELNIGIGLMNLIPVGPIDGGRMFHDVVHHYFRKRTANKIFKYVSLFFLAILLFFIFSGFFG